jgi:hypothetical protein
MITPQGLVRRLLGRPVDDEVDQPYDPEPDLNEVTADTYTQPDIGDEESGRRP